jgi:hypothetical protein
MKYLFSFVLLIFSGAAIASSSSDCLEFSKKAVQEFQEDLTLKMDGKKLELTNGKSEPGVQVYQVTSDDKLEKVDWLVVTNFIGKCKKLADPIPLN